MGRGRKESGGKAETPHEIFRSGSKPSSAGEKRSASEGGMEGEAGLMSAHTVEGKVSNRCHCHSTLYSLSTVESCDVRGEKTTVGLEWREIEDEMD